MDLNLPSLSEPYSSALASCIEGLFAHYDVVAIVATGTVVRGEGDARSDIDLHVLHAGAFRERVQTRYGGVPFEIFVNHPNRVRGYFEEDVKDRRPLAPHMFATGVIVFDSAGIAEELANEAKAILANRPSAPTDTECIALKYSAATEFEDVDDLADRDPAGADFLLGSAVRRLAECRVAIEPGWLPRAKDLLSRLRELDPESASLALESTGDNSFSERLDAARKLCRRVTGYEGFFEWKSPREEIPI